MPKTLSRSSEERYGREYFAPQLQRNVLGFSRGSRPFLYGYWTRYLSRACVAGAPVLEVGCGLAFFTSRLRRRYAATGLDISAVALAQARARWNSNALVCADAQDLPFGRASFDALFAFDVIEHIFNPDRFLSEAHRVLRTGGLMVISTPNPGSLGASMKGSTWFGHRDSTHISIRAIEDWREGFRRCGFKIEKDGSDFLWDPPYLRRIPRGLQRIVCIPMHWMIAWTVGFLPWSRGENYVAILRKPR